jgi:hypothetical protein
MGGGRVAYSCAVDRSPKLKATGYGQRTMVALPVLVTLTALFIWWGWRQGAYFDQVFYPGAIGVYALLALILWLSPPLRASGLPARIAFLSLLLLAGWTLLSIVWTPAPATAIAGAQRAFLYVALFALGGWLVRMLRERPLPAVAPVALAGALVGVATVITLVGGADIDAYVHGDGTLRFPIGYRNANAAFWLLCVWPLLALATDIEVRWWLRSLAIGSATMLIELGVLAQSRGSLPAVAVALLVYLIVSPRRLRAAAVIALAALPMLPALPTLLDVFQHGEADATTLELLHDSAGAIALTSALSVALSAGVMWGIQPRLRLGPTRVRRLSWVTGILAAIAVVVAGSAFISRHGGPVGFVDQRVSEFRRVGYPDLSRQGIRFGANVGSNRNDFWRVALREGADHPLLGGGPGSFELAYLKERRSGETPKDPHGSGFLMFSELGVPGTLLFVTFLVAAGFAGWRARRSSPSAAIVAAGALGGAVQCFFQGAYDWFWHYPGVTAPAIFLLGVAAGGDAIERGGEWTRRLRFSGLALAVLLAAVAVPLFLADRFTTRALQEWPVDVGGAYEDLDRAAELNPFDARPLLVKGVIASRVGNRKLALANFREARSRVPESYVSYFLIAQELERQNPVAARRALAQARTLNPRGLEVVLLGSRLKRVRGSARGDSALR